MSAIRGIALIALSASPVVAQDFSIDAHLIDRCLPLHDNPMVCVGRQADECVQRNGGGADMIYAACFEAEAAFWDDALNRAYLDLKRLAEAREADDLGYEPGTLVDGLRQMQLTWLAYRDASCANVTELAKPFGSAAGPAYSECLMTQTARQYFQLRGLRQSYLQ